MTDRQDPALLEPLRALRFDGLAKSIVDLELVPRVERDGDRIRVNLEMPAPSHPAADELADRVREALSPLAERVEVDVTWRVRTADFRHAALPGVRNVIAVASGKGGVGKSTVASNLAVGLAGMGAKAGLLDLDLYGPSVTKMLGKTETPQATPGDERVVPAEAHGVKFLSMAQFAPDDRAILWRGPMLHRMVGQLAGAAWDDLDYLVLDLPPGTGDVQLTLTQSFPLTGAVVVTTPQEIALIDARKGLTMFRDARIPLLGIVENLSWYDCAKCGKRHALFAEGGGERLAEAEGLPLLAKLPLLPQVSRASDAGAPVILQGGPASEPYRDLTVRVAAAVGRLNLDRNPFKVLS